MSQVPKLFGWQGWLTARFQACEARRIWRRWYAQLCDHNAHRLRPRLSSPTAQNRS